MTTPDYKQPDLLCQSSMTYTISRAEGSKMVETRESTTSWSVRHPSQQYSVPNSKCLVICLTANL
eukprot:c3600_g2_i1 orf=81-275(-)